MRPTSTGAVIEARETPNTTMDEAEAVRSGKASQQIMMRLGTVAPSRKPRRQMLTLSAQSGIGSSMNTR